MIDSSFFATQRRFDISPQRAKGLIAWDWRYAEMIAPDDACSRWLRADFQRKLIVDRARTKSYA